MHEINYWAVLVTAPVLVAASTIYYIAFGEQLKKLSKAMASMNNPPASVKVREMLRSLVLAFVIAHIFVLAGIDNWGDALALGLWLWVGFPVVLLSGSVMWEKVPRKLALIHAGDWLIKIFVVSTILNVWR